MMTARELDGNDEVVQKFLELFPPEQRLAGLSREQILMALPDDELRQLPEEYLATFSEPAREAVRERCGRQPARLRARAFGQVAVGHGKRHAQEACRFWAEQLTREAIMAAQELEGYDEVVQRFLELIPPEQRLAGLSREQMLMALPDDELRQLPEEYLATFSEPSREAVRRRCERQL